MLVIFLFCVCDFLILLEASRAGSHQYASLPVLSPPRRDRSRSGRRTGRSEPRSQSDQRSRMEHSPCEPRPRVNDSQGRYRSPPGSSHRRESDDNRSSAGRDNLRALAMASPKSASLCVANPPQSRESFAKWVTERVQVDSANLTCESLEVSGKRKFDKKLTPAKALQSLPPLQAMSDIYQDVYQVYARRLGRAIESISGAKRNSKAWQSLKRTSTALNIELPTGKFDETALAQLLARMRALDMVERPVE